MDSRQLYIAAQRLVPTLTWDEEWIYVGVGREVKAELVFELLNDFLKGNAINFVHERTNSGAFKLSEIPSKITALLGVSNFQLWNESMDKAIRFNSIGVILKGQRKL